MKSYRKELYFNVPKRRGFINITPEIETALRESGIKEGLLLCNAMHITASVFINDDESGLHQDFETWLEGLAPMALAKLGKNENVSMDVLKKICTVLNCNIGDILDFVPEKDE